MTGVVAALALLGNGVAFGVMVATVVGFVPLFRASPYERYVRLVRFLWPRFDPMMPILHMTTVLLDLALVALTRGAARWCASAGALLLLAVLAISVAKNVPINRYVLALDPAAAPRDWARLDPRNRWRAWNNVRTVLAAFALVANAAAVAVLR
ncbi:anthrone oxygenase family protein [Crossiella sp. NPDC003009]